MAETGVVECVPNFSEGRDLRVVDAIVDAIAATPGVVVLGRESDADHNRSVVTFAGGPQAVAAGALAGIGAAVERIDLSRHSGVHPRIGAADVVPLVPVRNVTLEDCAALAVEVGGEIWRRFGVPVYLYEAAARIEDRRRLENIRRGGLEWLRAHVEERPPDIGGARLHPTAGAAIVGARKLLIAFNVNLDGADLESAKAIARAVRESSGGLAAVKAMGVPLASRGCVQVSMNLTDFERTGVAEAFEAVRREAALRGIGIAGSELVGLVPRRAWEQAAAELLRCDGFGAERVLENRLEELAPERTFDGLLEEISRPGSPMGGGSAAALAAALGAALGYKVARLSHEDAERFAAHREFFAGMAGRDAAAFAEVSRARKAGESGERLQAAYRQAAAAPAELTERAKQLDRDLLELKDRAPAKLHSDVMTALGLSRAARAGGIAAAKANLAFIEDAEFRRQIEQRMESRPPSQSTPPSPATPGCSTNPDSSDR